MLSLLIPEAAKKEVTKRLAKLAKKAGVSLETVDGTTTLVLKDKRILVCSRVTVGDLPRTNGWAFVARLEHTEAGNLVSCAPGEIAALEWRTAEATCEHCGTSRRRRDTFVLRGPDGEVKQIGRNCLADFLMVDATQLVRQAEFVRTLGEESDPDHEGSWGSSYSMPSTDHYLACVVSSVELHGFRKTQEDASTKNEAAFFAGNRPKVINGDTRPLEAWKAGQPLPWHIDRAKLVREWAANLSAEDTHSSDYLWNLHLACKLLGCDLVRYAGILASAPSAYDRAMGLAVKKAEPKSFPTAPIGTVGKRETFLVTFVKRASFDNDYGGGIVCAFETSAGDQLVWFATGVCPSSDDLNKVMTLTGTPKKHTERNGRPQTVLTRCKFEVTELKSGKMVG
jgi:hypothetical protein